MSTLKIWISCARPRTLPAAIAPVVIGVAMAFQNVILNWLVATVTLVSALCIQIGTNFANDYFDFRKGTDTKDRVGPTRATSAGLIAPHIMIRAAFIVFAIATICGVYLVFIGGLPIVIIGITSLLCGIAYTAGPFPLGYIGLGELFVFVFFGPVAVGGTFYLLTHTITNQVLFAGAAPGLLSTAVLIVNNYRDQVTDKTTHKNTLVVLLGEAFGRIEYVAAILVACIIPLVIAFITKQHYWCVLASGTVIVALKPIIAMVKKPDSTRCNPMLGETGRLLFVYCTLFTVGWII